MSVAPEVLREVKDFAHAVLAWIGADGYPVSVAVDHRVDPEAGVVVLSVPTGEAVRPPAGEVNVIVSHVRPQEIGYDQRRYVQMWGRAEPANGELRFTPQRSHSWDESKMPFFEYSEVTVPQAHRYLEDLGREQGRRLRPRLSFGWLFLRATRLPFLTATLVPVLLGVAVAAREGSWSLWLAFLTFLGGAFVHLGLNVSNDVFDTMSGADAANTTPTQFSGGSRVIHYGLMSLRTMALMSAGFYLAGIAIGLYLAVTRGFWPLFTIGAIGVAISIAYTAPPLRLVHRGVGEIAVALGFGPIMLLGSYFVQAQRISSEAVYLSIPVAILIALVLYVNEVPDRRGDAAAGKRTLPVRLSKEAVIGGYVGALVVTYALIAGGAAAGLLPLPALLALGTIPLAAKCVRGIRRDYEDPYALMFSTMGPNVQLHLFTGMLLFAGYLMAIAADRLIENAPFFLR
ncbi:MAG TPA: prenyltransferase [Actinomycetota bacterium]|nr:prenyltransferase [Actinomycetota bacterium]